VKDNFAGSQTDRLMKKRFSETSSMLTMKHNPSYTFQKERPQNAKVFPHDASILARESPGPGSANPLFGGIGDKLLIK
jgi:hypothetical protein